MVPGCVTEALCTEVKNVLLFEPTDDLRHDLFVERVKWRLGFVGFDVLGIGPFATSNNVTTLTVTMVDRRDNEELEVIVKIEGKQFSII